MKWLVGIVITLLVLAGFGWIFRAEVALFGISQLVDSTTEIGPTQEISWSSGIDDRDPADRPPNIVLILADDLG